MRNSRANDILVSQFILVILATALVVARLNLRLRIQKRKLLPSDIFMIGAWVSGTITVAFSPAFAILDAFDSNESRAYIEGESSMGGPGTER
ncbi:hypothetical protein F53441_9776 [Fusarium austroafricanum]|uniref:Uncharacterized protein n=1 Tax=Fusarium austroafricanum TaxID=2364996 RepID=A0A8H4NSZ3_9HYPO|nr:hypothetical protein F53441_9776 [Fusarium austroafricanum]